MMQWNQQCPFCNKYINYYPNCAPSTFADYYNFGWCIQGKGKNQIKQFYHLSCLKKKARGKGET